MVPRLTGGVAAAFEMESGAPPQLEATADSTWSGDNVYALLLTLFGGAVAHSAKLLHLIVDSSTESEAVATAKACEVARSRSRLFSESPTVDGRDRCAKWIAC